MNSDSGLLSPESEFKLSFICLLKEWKIAMLSVFAPIKVKYLVYFDCLSTAIYQRNVYFFYQIKKKLLALIRRSVSARAMSNRYRAPQLQGDRHDFAVGFEET